jgi:hypothetical protein
MGLKNLTYKALREAKCFEAPPTPAVQLIGRFWQERWLNQEENGGHTLREGTKQILIEIGAVTSKIAKIQDFCFENTVLTLFHSNQGTSKLLIRKIGKGGLKWQIVRK